MGLQLIGILDETYAGDWQTPRGMLVPPAPWPGEWIWGLGQSGCHLVSPQLHPADGRIWPSGAACGCLSFPDQTPGAAG